MSPAYLPAVTSKCPALRRMTFVARSQPAHAPPHLCGARAVVSLAGDIDPVAGLHDASIHGPRRLQGSSPTRFADARERVTDRPGRAIRLQLFFRRRGPWQV